MPRHLIPLLFAGLFWPAAALAQTPPETLYAVSCRDSAEGHPKRATLRPEHLAYLASIGDRIVLGGGAVDAPGAAASGSLLIYRAESLAAAKALLAADPFSRAGVFGECRWTPFLAVLGAWLPKP